MNRLVLIVLLSFLWSGFAFSDGTNSGEKLEDEYHWFMPNPTKFWGYKSVKTDEKRHGYSVACDMGRAIPSADKEGYYSNKPIEGMSYHLIARAVQHYTFENRVDGVSNQGYGRVYRGAEVIKESRPLKGGIGISWPIESDETFVVYFRSNSEADDFGDMAELDLFEGTGLYYRNYKGIGSEANYFLYNCRKKTELLPYYESTPLGPYIDEEIKAMDWLHENNVQWDSMEERAELIWNYVNTHIRKLERIQN